MAGFFVSPQEIKFYQDQKGTTVTKPAKEKPSKEEVKQSQGAGTYGNGGSIAVHLVIVDLMWEIALVLVLSAIAAHGGAAKTVATVVMIGIALVWALNTFG